MHHGTDRDTIYYSKSLTFFQSFQSSKVLKKVAERELEKKK